MGSVPLLKWILILPVVGLSQAVQFNKLTFDGVDELSEFGIIDLSSNGRIDVKTNLNLSPWELFVINDLVFKLTSKQCPKMDQDALNSLKDMLSESFKQAPMAEIQNGEFLPSYSNLVRCLDFIEENPEDEKEKTETKLEQIQELDEKAIDQSMESDWAAKDAVISTTTTTTTEKPASNDQDELAASEWMWGFRSIHRWLVDIFLKENEDLSEAKLEKDIVEQRQEERKLEQQKRIEIAYRMARQNFANFFHEISKIVRKTCPLIHRPDRLFMRQAMLDMATWATLEQRPTISHAAEYFRKHEMLKLLQECLKEL